jgi:ABC-type Mn2+/Zn2+ transport system ATPase subunit
MRTRISQEERQTIREQVRVFQSFKLSEKMERESVQSLNSQLAAAEDGLALIQAAVQQMQESAHRQVASIVTQCLQAIFGPHLAFTLYFEQKRGRTEALMLVTDLQGNMIDPMTACGGGVVDVISFALRICALVLTKPSRRRLLVLDEPFKFVSAEYREGIADLLKRLSQDLQIQFVLVTHFTNLQLGKVIRIKK